MTLELRTEILKWMNYGIPDGKTVPDFEELLDQFEGEAVEATKIKNKETIEYYQLRARNEAIKECKEKLDEVVDREFPRGERLWCIQCAKRIRANITSDKTNL